MVQIKNKKELINNAKLTVNRKARKLALEALEKALEAAEPKHVIKSMVRLENSHLQIQNKTFNLQKFKNIYVVGGGKAGGSMVEALEEIMGKRITNGALNIPYDSGEYQTTRVKLQRASHPVPDEAGVKGTKNMLDLVAQAKEDDLVICLISGGGSSLMPLPREGISLQDKKKVTELLLKSGATINEINTVRKHISAVKGGWLAKEAYPATVINLILSDVIGDPLDFIASGPTVPDSTTFQDAIQVLEKYGLWDKIPNSVRQVLLHGKEGLIPETPKAKDKVFRKVYNFVLGNNRLASIAAQNKLKNTGLHTLLLTSQLEGEARHVGTMLASIAHEIIASGNPIPKPAGIIAGGETTVTVVGKGIGGRNQEIALSAALKISNMKGIVIASMSTDGIDGPTDAAGAIVDGQTVIRSQKMGLNPTEFLKHNDSYTFFSKLNDLIFTGLTGTNVNDISILIAI